MIVVAYGLILPKSVLEIPHFGCVNIHASLLPRWRGAAPIQRAIEAGDKETGISILQMDEGLDTGGVIAMGKIPIAQEDTAATLHDKLAELGAKMILQTLGEIEKGEAKTTPQSEYGVTYAEKIRKEESALDFNLSADELAKRINAFNPFPGASANVNGTTVKLWHAKADMRQHNAKNGEVISANQDGVYIACADGVLCVSELQKAGGKKLNAKEFIKGFPLSGQIFQSEKK